MNGARMCAPIHAGNDRRLPRSACRASKKPSRAALAPRVDADYLACACIGTAQEVGAAMLRRSPPDIEAAARFATEPDPQRPRRRAAHDAEEERRRVLAAKALVHLALSRSDAALIKASGGEPRTVRGMTLDPALPVSRSASPQARCPVGKHDAACAARADGALSLSVRRRARWRRAHRAHSRHRPQPFGAVPALSADRARQFGGDAGVLPFRRRR